MLTTLSLFCSAREVLLGNDRLGTEMVGGRSPHQKIWPASDPCNHLFYGWMELKFGLIIKWSPLQNILETKADRLRNQKYIGPRPTFLNMGRIKPLNTLGPNFNPLWVRGRYDVDQGTETMTFASSGALALSVDSPRGHISREGFSPPLLLCGMTKAFQFPILEFKKV